MSDSPPLSILFAGGGTGGHIFPNIAIRQRLAELRPEIAAHFLVSTRPLDMQILEREQQTGVALPFQPLAIRKPWTWPRTIRSFGAATTAAAQVIAEKHACFLVATGGFVSVPAGRAAGKTSVPLVLVNLDAVPGKANSYLAGHVAVRFTCYDVPAWRDAQRIGLPLTEKSIGPIDKTLARAKLGLLPDHETLLVTGGSQGAETLNDMMMTLINQTRGRGSLRNWQVLHLAGPGGNEAERIELLRAAYEKAGIPARVESFCNQMGLAWSAATLAICRAGAGTVAEVHANATPAVFLPYPFHRDQHQRRNAKALADAGSAVMLSDLRDAEANARQIMGPLDALIRNASRRNQMTRQLRASCPPNGAAIVAEWLAERIES